MKQTRDAFILGSDFILVLVTVQIKICSEACHEFSS